MALMAASTGYAQLLSPQISSHDPLATLSARRPAHLPAQWLISRAENSRPSELWYSSQNSVLGQRGSFENANWALVPAIQPLKLQASFETVREHRYLKDSRSRDRRATWLYPDDGCFMRASIATSILETDFTLKPAKIFVFGNLSTQTPNHPYGEVTWWYHVAAITKTLHLDGAGQQVEKYHVYDPAIDPLRPLSVEEWVGAMNDPSVQIAICDAEAYDPHSDCLGGPKSLWRIALDSDSLLENEWHRVRSMGRNPELELGDEPPWSVAR
jgi:hypothetical protein